MSSSYFNNEINFIEKIYGEVKNYNFYQLVNILYKIIEQDPDSEESQSAYNILFSSSKSLGFASSDVSDLNQEDGCILIETTFLGLNGAQSPLPNYFLDGLASSDDDGIRKDFFDFFNHRIIMLLYRIWRKYRYYSVFKENAEDKISQHIFSLIGLNIKELRAKNAINWPKMLSYSGMLTGKSRSTQVVSGIVGHYFDIPVSVTQWCERLINIPEKQKTQLGGGNSMLGADTILGDKIKDCSGKFVLNIHSLTFRRFRDFLPSGKDFTTLQEVVSFILRTQMAYDINLELAPYEAPPFRLDKSSGCYLGWTSFMGGGDGEKSVRIQVKQ